MSSLRHQIDCLIENLIDQAPCLSDQELDERICFIEILQEMDEERSV